MVSSRPDTINRGFADRDRAGVGSLLKKGNAMPMEAGTRMFSGLEINRATASTGPRLVIPLTGALVALGYDERVLYVAPAGPLNRLTINLPPNAMQGSIVTISFAQPIAGLTIQDAIGNLVMSTSAAANVGQEYRYVATSGYGWVRWI